MPVSEDNTKIIWKSKDLSLKINNIKKNNNGFVACGSYGTIAKSNDLLEWNNINVGEDIEFKDILKNDKITICVGYKTYPIYSGYKKNIAYTEDNENWTILEDNAVTVVGTPDKEVNYSSYLKSTFNETTYGFNSICYGNGVYVVVGFGYDESVGASSVCYSNNGINWYTKAITKDTEFIINNIWNSVEYYNGIFVAVGDNGCVMYSTDGINWKKNFDDYKTQRNIRVNTYVYDDYCLLDYDERFVRYTAYVDDYSSNKIFTYYENNEGNYLRINDEYCKCEFYIDDKTHTEKVKVPYITTDDILNGENKISVDYNQNIKFYDRNKVDVICLIDNQDKSENINWNKVKIILGRHVENEVTKKIEYPYAQFFFLGNKGKIYTSNDGINFSQYNEFDEKYNFLDVEYCNGLYFAIDESGTIAISRDFYATLLDYKTSTFKNEEELENYNNNYEKEYFYTWYLYENTLIKNISKLFFNETEENDDVYYEIKIATNDEKVIYTENILYDLKINSFINYDNDSNLEKYIGTVSKITDNDTSIIYNCIDTDFYTSVKCYTRIFYDSANDMYYIPYFDTLAFSTTLDGVSVIDVFGTVADDNMLIIGNGETSGSEIKYNIECLKTIGETTVKFKEKRKTIRVTFNKGCVSFERNQLTDDNDNLIVKFYSDKTETTQVSAVSNITPTYVCTFRYVKKQMPIYFGVDKLNRFSYNDCIILPYTANHSKIKNSYIFALKDYFNRHIEYMDNVFRLKWNDIFVIDEVTSNMIHNLLTFEEVQNHSNLYDKEFSYKTNDDNLEYSNKNSTLLFYSDGTLINPKNIDWNEFKIVEDTCKELSEMKLDDNIVLDENMSIEDFEKTYGSNDITSIPNRDSLYESKSKDLVYNSVKDFISGDNEYLYSIQIMSDKNYIEKEIDSDTVSEISACIEIKNDDIPLSLLNSKTTTKKDIISYLNNKNLSYFIFNNSKKIPDEFIDIISSEITNNNYDKIKNLYTVTNTYKFKENDFNIKNFECGNVQIFSYNNDAVLFYDFEKFEKDKDVKISDNNIKLDTNSILVFADGKYTRNFEIYKKYTCQECGKTYEYRDENKHISCPFCRSQVMDGELLSNNYFKLTNGDIIKSNEFSLEYKLNDIATNKLYKTNGIYFYEIENNSILKYDGIFIKVKNKNNLKKTHYKNVEGTKQNSSFVVCEKEDIDYKNAKIDYSYTDKNTNLTYILNNNLFEVKSSNDTFNYINVTGEIKNPIIFENIVWERVEFSEENSKKLYIDNETIKGVNLYYKFSNDSKNIVTVLNLSDGEYYTTVYGKYIPSSFAEIIYKEIKSEDTPDNNTIYISCSSIYDNIIDIENIPSTKKKYYVFYNKSKIFEEINDPTLEFYKNYDKVYGILKNESTFISMKYNKLTTVLNAEENVLYVDCNMPYDNPKNVNESEKTYYIFDKVNEKFTEINYNDLSMYDNYEIKYVIVNSNAYFMVAKSNKILSDNATNNVFYIDCDDYYDILDASNIEDNKKRYYVLDSASNEFVYVSNPESNEYINYSRVYGKVYITDFYVETYTSYVNGDYNTFYNDTLTNKIYIFNGKQFEEFIDDNYSYYEVYILSRNDMFRTESLLYSPYSNKFTFNNIRINTTTNDYLNLKYNDIKKLSLNDFIYYKKFKVFDKIKYNDIILGKKINDYCLKIKNELSNDYYFINKTQKYFNGICYTQGNNNYKQVTVDKDFILEYCVKLVITFVNKNTVDNLFLSVNNTDFIPIVYNNSYTFNIDNGSTVEIIYNGINYDILNFIEKDVDVNKFLIFNKENKITIPYFYNSIENNYYVENSSFIEKYRNEKKLSDTCKYDYDEEYVNYIKLNDYNKDISVYSKKEYILNIEDETSNVDINQMYTDFTYYKKNYYTLNNSIFYLADVVEEYTSEKTTSITCNIISDNFIDECTIRMNFVPYYYINDISNRRFIIVDKNHCEVKKYDYYIVVTDLSNTFNNMTDIINKGYIKEIYKSEKNKAVYLIKNDINFTVTRNKELDDSYSYGEIIFDNDTTLKLSPYYNFIAEYDVYYSKNKRYILAEFYDDENNKVENYLTITKRLNDNKILLETSNNLVNYVYTNGKYISSLDGDYILINGSFIKKVLVMYENKEYYIIDRNAIDFYEYKISYNALDYYKSSIKNYVYYNNNYRLVNSRIEKNNIGFKLDENITSSKIKINEKNCNYTKNIIYNLEYYPQIIDDSIKFVFAINKVSQNDISITFTIKGMGYSNFDNTYSVIIKSGYNKAELLISDAVKNFKEFITNNNIFNISFICNIENINYIIDDNDIKSNDIINSNSTYTITFSNDSEIKIMNSEDIIVQSYSDDDIKEFISSTNYFYEYITSDISKFYRYENNYIKLTKDIDNFYCYIDNSLVYCELNNNNIYFEKSIINEYDVRKFVGFAQRWFNIGGKSNKIIEFLNLYDLYDLNIIKKDEPIFYNGKNTNRVFLKIESIARDMFNTVDNLLYRGEINESEYKPIDIENSSNKNSTLIFNENGECISQEYINWANAKFTTKNSTLTNSLVSVSLNVNKPSIICSVNSSNLVENTNEKNIYKKDDYIIEHNKNDNSLTLKLKYDEDYISKNEIMFFINGKKVKNDDIYFDEENISYTISNFNSFIDTIQTRNYIKDFYESEECYLTTKEYIDIINAKETSNLYNIDEKNDLISNDLRVLTENDELLLQDDKTIDISVYSIDLSTSDVIHSIYSRGILNNNEDTYFAITNENIKDNVLDYNNRYNYFNLKKENILLFVNGYSSRKFTIKQDSLYNKYIFIPELNKNSTIEWFIFNDTDNLWVKENNHHKFLQSFILKSLKENIISNSL